MNYFIRLFAALIISFLICAISLERSFSSESHAFAQKNLSLILKGERELLLFDIYWMGIYVGKASFEAINNKGNIVITTRANSAPVISTFYKVEDYARSELTNGKPNNFKIIQHEGRYRSNKETIFDNKNNRIIYFNHLKGEKIEHNSVYTTLWDVVSGFYHVRTMPFEVGKAIYVNIFDSNKFYNAEVKVIGREKITVYENREVNTVIIKPLLQSAGLFRKKGDVYIWLTDDDKRVPVKMETTISIGKITALLKSVETE